MYVIQSVSEIGGDFLEAFRTIPQSKNSCFCNLELLSFHWIYHIFGKTISSLALDMLVSSRNVFSVSLLSFFLK